MRFKDEKSMWWADTERLARRLANKSDMEIQEILDATNVITLRTGDRPQTSVAGRLLSPFVFVLILALSGCKWIATGDRYIDSWEKKYKALHSVCEFCGIK